MALTPEPKNEVPSIKNAQLYQQVADGLSGYSRSRKPIMRQLTPELPADMSTSEIVKTAIDASKGLSRRHPSEWLHGEEKTQDIMAMINVYGSLQNLLETILPHDREVLKDYAKLYGAYRMAYLEFVLEQARSGDVSKRTHNLREVQTAIGSALYSLDKKAEDPKGFREKSSEIEQGYIRLIEGQIDARLRSQGKSLDTMLMDPTIERLTEGDIRAATYQYDLIISALTQEK
ncbi:MAG: hypothetical protein Q8P56_04090 [Candidatus Uhrbacteria bacterium]|nr:hypothetical protein [Candidatus Uhrbacteria bacterium]